MTLKLQATPEEVMRAVEALEAFGQKHHVEARLLQPLMLALEECASNIVNHAFDRDPRRSFQVSFEHTGDAILVELRDRGPAFDPTQAPIRTPQPMDEVADGGGWGIQLARRFTDEIQYGRENEENILRLIKRLRPPA
jgi:serine/threonine-protein kinase RsbW